MLSTSLRSPAVGLHYLVSISWPLDRNWATTMRKSTIGMLSIAHGMVFIGGNHAGSQRGHFENGELAKRGTAVQGTCSSTLDDWGYEASGKARESLWHVYLDNFAAGEVDFCDGPFDGGRRLHSLAEKAWEEAGVVSSSKKRKSAEEQAQELGAFIDGKNKTIGGSPERLLKLVQATIIVLKQPHLSKKLTQVLAGRWVHVFQFKAAGNVIFGEHLTFTTSKKFEAALIWKVRRELFSCCCSLPSCTRFWGRQSLR